MRNGKRVAVLSVIPGKVWARFWILGVEVRIGASTHRMSPLYSRSMLMPPLVVSR